jgi:hypothetical protein
MTYLGTLNSFVERKKLSGTKWMASTRAYPHFQPSTTSRFAVLARTLSKSIQGKNGLEK